MPAAKKRPATTTDAGTFVRYDGLRCHQFPATWLGDVCVFQDVGMWGVGTVGHLVVLHVRTRDDAHSVAEIVKATLGGDLRLRDGEELKRRFPEWFRHWGVAVRRAGKYLDPGPYLDGKREQSVTDGARR